MSAPQFTPGPWKAKQALGGTNFRVFYEDRGIGWVRETRLDHDRSGGFSEANARLIAAAPELYEAARRALNFIENTESEHNCELESGDRLRAALAKARGEA